MTKNTTLTVQRSVEISLSNAEGALETVREHFDRMLAAHVLLLGAWGPGDAVYDASRDPIVVTFGENAAEVVAHLNCLRSYFDEIRRELRDCGEPVDSRTVAS